MKDRDKECPICGKSHRLMPAKCFQKIRKQYDVVVSLDLDGQAADKILWLYERFNIYLRYMRWA
jgi:hypothetical protein